MKDKDMTFSQQDLEMLPSQELRDMIHAELEKDSIDRDPVLQMLRILEEREAEDPAMHEVDDSAVWEEFRSHISATEADEINEACAGKQRRTIPWILKTAIAATIIFAILVFAPPAMGFDNVVELIGHWTQSVFGFVPSDASKPTEEYVFKTDHPGLQQIYDEVSGLGITQPVVPTWVPDGYELKEMKVIPMPAGTRIHATLVRQNLVIIITIEAYREDSASKYEKNKTGVLVHEIASVKHYLIPNEDKWIAVWEINGFECSVLTSENETILYRILQSIYKENN